MLKETKAVNVTKLIIQVISIKRDEETEFDLQELEKLIIEKKPKMFYLVTTHHNPTGANLSLKQRNSLYNLALKYKFYIVTDDVYELLYDTVERQFPPLSFCSDDIINNYNPNVRLDFDIDNNPYIISMNSFSKILFPGYRAVILILIINQGFLLIASDLVKRIEDLWFIWSGGCVNNTIHHFVASMIELGFQDKVLDIIRNKFKERINTCLEILVTGNEQDKYKIKRVKGGYFLWVQLSEKYDLNVLKDLFTKYDISVIYGDTFIQVEDKEKQEFMYLKRRLRLSFAFMDLEVLKEACINLKRALEEAFEESNK